MIQASTRVVARSKPGLDSFASMEENLLWAFQVALWKPSR